MVTTDSGDQIKLEIWDTAGQEAYRSILPLYYKAAGVVVLVFDLTRKASFEELGKFWVKQVEEQCDPKVVTVLVGNKVDLPASRQVTEEVRSSRQDAVEISRPLSRHRFDLGDAQDAQLFATKNGLLYVETSAKIGTNIDSLFKTAASSVHPSLQKSSASRNRLMERRRQGNAGGDGCAC